MKSTRLLGLSVLAALFVAAALGCGAASARKLFVGDYQTGDISQWPAHQYPPGGIKVGSGLTIVPPPFPYRQVARFTIGLGKPSDRRSEVLRRPVQTDAVPGLDTWWRWYIYFPNNFRGPPNRQGDMIMSDWHNTVSGCAPPIIFVTHDGKKLLTLIRAGRTLLQTHQNIHKHWPPVPKGFEGRNFIDGRHACNVQTYRQFTAIPQILRNHWYELTMHIKWARIPSHGLFSLWVDGCLVTPPSTSPRYHFATMMDPRWGQVYLKQGMYDPHGWPVGTPPASVFYTGTTQYTTSPSLFPPAQFCPA